MANQEIKNGVSGTLPPAVTEMKSLSQLLTSQESEALFQEKISKADTSELQRIASVMMRNPNFFLTIIRNDTGFTRVQKLFGLSSEADVFFCAAILNRFLKIMTINSIAFELVLRGMAVFDQDQKRMLYEFTLDYSLDLACDRHGRDGLNGIITYSEDPYYKKLLCYKIAKNAKLLSYDVYGSIVVRKVLEQNDLRVTHYISVTLDGSCVDLSFTMPGSFVVEKLLGATLDSMFYVVHELLMCDGYKLMRLARDQIGNCVVRKALSITREKRHQVNLFERLVNKLMSIWTSHRVDAIPLPY